MTRIAFLTARSLLEVRVDRGPHGREHDRELGALRPACAAIGIALDPVAWDDVDLDPAAFAGFVIGSAWDYAARPDVFVDALSRLAAVGPLFNSLAVVRWNLEKTYLRDLSARDVPCVPTLWRSAADLETIRAAHDELGVDELVVKPRVGASSWRQTRVTRGGPPPAADALPLGACQIQPFLQSITTEGEYSFVFFDGAFSHAVRKVPARGDYRVQSNFGGREERYEPSAADLLAARQVIDVVEERLLYARVDLVRDSTGHLVVMELELIEPYLHPEQAPAMGDAFARALVRRLEGG